MEDPDFNICQVATDRWTRDSERVHMCYTVDSFLETSGVWMILSVKNICEDNFAINATFT